MVRFGTNRMSRFQNPKFKMHEYPIIDRLLTTERHLGWNKDITILRLDKATIPIYAQCIFFITAASQPFLNEKKSIANIKNLIRARFIEYICTVEYYFFRVRLH